jgi:thiol-disulfide isomerase/thioredoxin
MGREPTERKTRMILRTDGSAQEVGMRNLRLKNVLLKSLVAIALAVIPTEAQDYGGPEKAPSIDWRPSYRRAVDEAVRDGKPLLVSVTATWCGPCRQMKQLTFTDSRVIDIVQSNFVPYMIDADEHPELVTGFGVEAYPTTMVVAPDLTILKRMAGFQSAGDLVANVTSLSSASTLVRTQKESDEPVSALQPANSITFGFDGYCLVSILEESRVRRGSAEFVAEHRGQMICFQSDEHRQKFLADPEKYWPVANGQCLVSSRESGSAGKGDPRMAVTWRGRIWLFSDRERQQRFIQTPFYYVNDL